MRPGSSPTWRLPTIAQCHSELDDQLSTADDPSAIVFDDPVSSLDFQWRNAVAGASLETIADAGHFPQWEQPQVFADRIAAFART